MLPQLYQTTLQKYLNPSQLLTLEMLVWLLQTHKQIRIERLAALLPLPILYQSRRRHVQRFLKSRQLSVTLIWLAIVEKIILLKIPPGQPAYLAVDRTQWQKNNLFVAALIWQKKAIPIYWQFLDKRVPVI